VPGLCLPGSTFFSTANSHSCGSSAHLSPDQAALGYRCGFEASLLWTCPLLISSSKIRPPHLCGRKQRRDIPAHLGDLIEVEGVTGPENCAGHARSPVTCAGQGTLRKRTSIPSVSWRKASRTASGYRSAHRSLGFDRSFVLAQMALAMNVTGRGWQSKCACLSQ